MFIISNSEKKGRNLLMLAVIVFLGFSVFDLVSYAIYVFNVGYERLVSQFIQLILRIGLTYFLYKGRQWARILIGVLLILDSLAYLFRIVEAVISSVPIDYFLIFVGAAFIINMFFGILLLGSRNIKEFLDFQRSRL